jgi:hypothetical protein
MISVTDPVIKNIIGAVNESKSLNWSALKEAFEKSDWFGLGVLTLEDACEIVKPWVPQAKIAEDIIKMLAAIEGSLPKSPSEKIDINKIIQSIAIAEGVDWKALQNALMGNNAFLAGSLVFDDIVKLISPFVSIPTPISSILKALILFGENTKPMDAEMLVILDKVKNGEELNSVEKLLYEKYIGETNV